MTTDYFHMTADERRAYRHDMYLKLKDVMIAATESCGRRASDFSEEEGSVAGMTINSSVLKFHVGLQGDGLVIPIVNTFSSSHPPLFALGAQEQISSVVIHAAKAAIMNRTGKTAMHSETTRQRPFLFLAHLFK